MSLLKKKAAKLGELSQPVEQRGELTTEAAVIEKQRVETRAYQKEHRKKNLDAYNDEKSKVDAMSPDELTEYLSDNEQALAVRVGIHTMKVNAYEQAIIKKALELTGAKSSREQYIKMCKGLIASN